MSQNFTLWEPLEVKLLLNELNELNCFFVVWLTGKRRLALFPTGTTVTDPHQRGSPTRHEQDFNLRRTCAQAYLNEVV